MKTILITGAGSGIGRACAETFLDAGWRVGLFGRRVEPLEEVARGEATLVLPGDVTVPGEVEGAVAQVAEAWGRLDCCFVNAGVFKPSGPLDELDMGEIEQLIAINVTGAFRTARAAFGQMRAQDPQGGRNILNGSISAHTPRPGSAPYTASKHAITGLTKSLSLDGRPYGIAAGQIDVGNALTEMAAPMVEGVPQADGSVRPEPVMDVRHVADAVLHMAGLPPEANVQTMTVMATAMPFVGRG